MCSFLIVYKLFSFSRRICAKLVGNMIFPIEWSEAYATEALYTV